MKRGLVIFACILEAIYVLHLVSSGQWSFDIGENLAETIKLVVFQLAIALFLILGIVSKANHKDEEAD